MKMVITVSDYELLRSIIEDAAVEANERTADARVNDSRYLPSLQHLAEAIASLRQEVEQASR